MYLPYPPWRESGTRVECLLGVSYLMRPPTLRKRVEGFEIGSLVVVLMIRGRQIRRVQVFRSRSRGADMPGGRKEHMRENQASTAVQGWVKKGHHLTGVRAFTTQKLQVMNRASSRANDVFSRIHGISLV